MPFVRWIDDKNFISVRSFVLYITVWMTWRAFTWAADYAGAHSGTSGSDVALIIAAVTAPISVLQGFVFKVYSESRR